MTKEHVVIVDSNNQQIGLADKATVHTDHTPLHRAFSVFMFNDKGELLLQQRALGKITWPGIWSNSCCGHPSFEETPQQAAKRRLLHELGLKVDTSDLKVILPDFSYRAEMNGVVEHEICPVLVISCSNDPLPNSSEVNDIKWIDWQEFILDIQQPNSFSPWCVEEALLLQANSEFLQFYADLTTNTVE